MSGRYLNRGAIFDLAILAANFWLVPRLAGLPGSGATGEVIFGGLLLISLPLYCLGAGLKRGPLAKRLRGSKPPFGSPWPIPVSTFPR